MVPGPLRCTARLGLVAVVLLTVLALTPVRAAAATATWTGGGFTADWSDAGNWQYGNLPLSGDVVVFPQGAGNRHTIDDLPGLAPSSLVFEDLGYEVDPGTGVASLTLLGATPVDLTAGTAIVNVPLALSQSSATMRADGAGSFLRLAQAFSGNAVTYAGAGVIVLDGSNTYAGGTTVGDGSGQIAVVANVSGALGSGTIVDYGQVTLAASSGATWTNAFELHGYGPDETGALTTSPMCVPSGCTQTISGPVTIAQDATIDLGYAAYDGHGGQRDDLTLTGLVSGSGSLEIDGHTFTSGTTYGTDTLTVAGSVSNTDTGPVTMSDVVVDLENPFPTTGFAATSYDVGRYALFSESSSMEIPSTSDLTVAGTYDGDNQTVHDVTMARGDAVNLTVDGTITGPTGGSMENLTLPNPGQQVSGGMPGWPQSLGPQLVLRAPIAPYGWTVAGGNVGLLGSEQGGAITVQQGMLDVAPERNAGSLDAPVTVEPGAALVGNGGDGTATVTVHGGTLFPFGGYLDVGAVTLDSSSTYRFVPTDPMGGGLEVTQPLSLNGATLQILPYNGEPDVPLRPGESWTLVENHSGQPVQGTFTGLPQGATFSADGFSGFSIDYQANGEDDVVVQYRAPSTILVSPAASSPIVYMPGHPVSFTVTVDGDPCCAAPTGTVTMWDGYAPLQTSTLQSANGTAEATFSVTFSSWPHSIWFVYNGDAYYLPSVSWATALEPSNMPSGPVGHAGSPAGPGVSTGPPAPGSTAGGTTAAAVHGTAGHPGTTLTRTGENADLTPVGGAGAVAVPDAGASASGLTLAGLVCLLIGAIAVGDRQRSETKAVHR